MNRNNFQDYANRFLRTANFDPTVARIAIYVWPKYRQLNETGMLSNFIRAQSITSDYEKILQQLNVLLPYYSGLSVNDKARYDFVRDRPPTEAFVRWRNIATLRQAIQVTGPSLTGAQFDTAIADFNANSTPQNPHRNITGPGTSFENMDSLYTQE